MRGPSSPPDTGALSGTGSSARVLLVVTGGIAAYKACTIVRRLVDADCHVQVAMTDSATRFVTPMTFEALSGHPVGTSLWGEGGEDPLDHIQWAQDCDLLLVAPATANFIAKMAHGLADDLCSTLVTATDAPVVVAPAMNDRMWANPPNRENLRLLRERGIEVIDPGSGYLACGTVAEGRLAEPEVVALRVLDRLRGGPMQGWKVVVTAGGTREPIDAVRWIGNHSSGRMGMALAEVARDRGAGVTLLLGPTELTPPGGMEVERFTTSAQLAALLDRHVSEARAVFMSAAVSDFRPKRAQIGKLKKSEGLASLELEATDDLLAGLGEKRASSGRAEPFLIGFALEAGDDAVVEDQARRKLERKKLDLVCGNRADVEGEGFSADTNRLFLYGRDGQGAWTPVASKRELAAKVIDRVLSLAG